MKKSKIKKIATKIISFEEALKSDSPKCIYIKAEISKETKKELGLPANFNLVKFIKSMR